MQLRPEHIKIWVGQAKPNKKTIEVRQYILEESPVRRPFR